MTISHQSDGSILMDSPPNGYNDHFWIDPRGVYTANTVDGVFVIAQVRTDNPNANLISNFGADWWLSPTATYVDDQSTNPGVGVGAWVKLTTSYQYLFFTNATRAQLEADPPPPLVGTGGTPAPTVSIAANPTSVSSGGSSTLTWSSTNATSCTASGGWSGTKATSGTQSLSNLTSTATYTLTCTGTGGSANQSATVTVTAAGDTQAPSTPTNLTASAVSSSQINLSWSASTDNVGVTGYRVYRGSTQVGTSATNSYNDTGLSPSTSYSYYVTAYDAAGNVSGNSNTASATTQASGGGTTITLGDTSVLPGNDYGNGNLLLVQNANLSQTATIQSLSFYVRTAAGNLRLGIYDATGPSGGPGHLIAQTNSFTPTTGWNTQPVTSQVLLPAGNYWLAYFPSSSSLHFAVSTNNVGNYKYANLTFGAMPATFPSINGQGTAHWSLYATLNTASSVDTTPPSIPSNLSATAVSSSAINLSWTASTDNVGVTGYKVYRGGVQVGTSATNSYSDTGLSASTAYTYTVSAYDAAGNNSAQSSSASATTFAPPPPPPTVVLSANPQSRTTS